MALDFWNYKKSEHRGGGLKMSTLAKSRNNTYVPARSFVAPKKIDYRDMCIQTSNQGQTPHCAGYACAGLIEVKNWRINHFPEQIDGDRIYDEAKKIDGMTGDGTSLDAAANAAINMKLIDGRPKLVEWTDYGIQFALHTHMACMGGFNITNEWNTVHKSTGRISNFGRDAKNLGGHAVLICGYDQEGLYIQNSWGPDWGIYGFALLPWDLVERQYMYGLVIV